MTDTAPTRRKIRPEAVWAEARRAWEGGVTARSVARRYDVGAPACGSVARRRGDSGRIGAMALSPADGWDTVAMRAWDEFEELLG